MKLTQLDQLCINTIRTLSIDAVQKSQSGLSGTPTAYCLWQHFLNTIQMIRTGLAEPCPLRVRVMRKTFCDARLVCPSTQHYYGTDAMTVRRGSGSVTIDKIDQI